MMGGGMPPHQHMDARSVQPPLSLPNSQCPVNRRKIQQQVQSYMRTIIMCGFGAAAETMATKYSIAVRVHAPTRPQPRSTIGTVFDIFKSGGFFLVEYEVNL
jgi:hypothetical protein